ncbi:MAG: YidC/Oxa1 family membrane protein insertase [Chloroflexi bacterium]|nr:YidC/Oxa1 family membrane protein insertase [Chloroflexota bacterium]
MGTLWETYVIGPMTWALTQLAHFTGSYALAIIVFTAFVRLALYPLTIQQLRSSRKTMVLQPQIQELKTKYGNDRVKLNEETMRLYRENNANPVAGCLPTLIQFPILIALYSSLNALISQPGIHASFLWVQNLALPDFWSVTNPVTQQQVRNGFFILPVLAAALQWIQQRMMMNPMASQDPQQRMMNQMMQFMPLMVLFFGFRFPAGLALYWVTNTFVSVVLQYFVTGWGTLPQVVPALGRIAFPGAGILAGGSLVGVLPSKPEKPARSESSAEASSQEGPRPRSPRSARLNGSPVAKQPADGTSSGSVQRTRPPKSSARSVNSGPGRQRPSPGRRQGSK